MKIVEHYPAFNWAAGPLVTRAEGDCLWVVGGGPYWTSTKDEYPNRDLVAEYRKAPRTGWDKGRTGKNSPHIQFANADTDPKLIAFVERFGPVVARSVEEREGEEQFSLERVPTPPVLVAKQGINELRSERIIYRSALALLAELKQGKKADIATVQNYISEIADGVSAWPEQWKHEQQWRAMKYQGKVPWEFSNKALRRIDVDKSEAVNPRLTLGDRIGGLVTTTDELTAGQRDRVIKAGHGVICELVNAFRPWVYPWDGRAFQGPHWDRRYGIRPLLYDILRQEYMTGAVAVCANILCRELFEIERAGQQFCSNECSQRQRQRDYWKARGKKLREQRRKRKRMAPKKEIRKGR